jgi:hypothetical protein
MIQLRWPPFEVMTKMQAELAIKPQSLFFKEQRPKLKTMTSVLKKKSIFEKLNVQNKEQVFSKILDLKRFIQTPYKN